MESFSYVDIYATKGIEYIIVIAFLVLTIFFFRYLLRVRETIPGTAGWFTIPMDKVVNLWVKQALHDLENAKKNLKIEVYDVCLVLCQQAVEKILKALYIKKTGDYSPPRIHSLRKLVEITGMSDEALKLVGELDSYYLALRYPDVTDKMPYEYCDQVDAEQGVKKAEEVINLVIGEMR